MESYSTPQDHVNALLRADGHAKATAETVVAVDIDFVFNHRAGQKVANIDAQSTVRAVIEIGDLDELSAIALISWIKEISAAIVTAETDAVSYGPILVVAKRPSHQILGFRFLQNLIYLRTGDFFLTRATALIFLIEHEANVHARPKTAATSLTATTVGNPELVVSIDQRPSFVPSTDIMKC